LRSARLVGVWPRVGGLRAFTLGHPGEMQDRLNALVLAGEKVATAGLWQHEYVDDGEVLDAVGEHQVLIDADGQPMAVVEITRVKTHGFAEVPWEFAAAEGEGFASIEDWRSGHRSYYASEGLAVDDDDLFVCVWFRVVDREAPAR
jgi:uncharacterized protein YhfF